MHSRKRKGAKGALEVYCPRNVFSLWSQKCHILCFPRAFSGNKYKRKCDEGGREEYIIFIVFCFWNDKWIKETLTQRHQYYIIQNIFQSSQLNDKNAFRRYGNYFSRFQLYAWATMYTDTMLLKYSCHLLWYKFHSLHSCWLWFCFLCRRMAWQLYLSQCWKDSRMPR